MGKGGKEEKCGRRESMKESEVLWKRVEERSKRVKGYDNYGRKEGEG